MSQKYCERVTQNYCERVSQNYCERVTQKYCERVSQNYCEICQDSKGRASSATQERKGRASDVTQDKRNRATMEKTRSHRPEGERALAHRPGARGRRSDGRGWIMDGPLLPARRKVRRERRGACSGILDTFIREQSIQQKDGGQEGTVGKSKWTVWTSGSPARRGQMEIHESSPPWTNGSPHVQPAVDK